ncbi:unnamed protein product [Ilex paraguariensis]|uniref:Folate-biopterin transporter 4 n=1 Tax=Ilex paraguariensis TaxID=185542 RepID=A0ABC8T1M9_9AQUA
MPCAEVAVLCITKSGEVLNYQAFTNSKGIYTVAETMPESDRWDACLARPISSFHEHCTHLGDGSSGIKFSYKHPSGYSYAVRPFVYRPANIPMIKSQKLTCQVRWSARPGKEGSPANNVILLLLCHPHLSPLLYREKIQTRFALRYDQELLGPLSIMIQLAKQLRKAFGASFLWLVCLIYFTQGFRSFVWTAVSYQLKDNLKLSPSASQFVSSIAFFPWSIKPLYGILSDCIPIRGRKRIPYLMIATLLSLFPWVLLGLTASSRNSKVQLMTLLSLQNLGSAMADVVIDAMIAEAVRFERASFAGDLQSISWMAMALGGIGGSLLGGYALTNLQIDKIFLLFAVLPSMQLLSCGLVEERSVSSKVLLEVSTSNGSLVENTSILDEDNFSAKNSKNSTSRRKKSMKNSKKKLVITDNLHIHEKHGSMASQWFRSFKMATYTLFQAFRQPIILRPMAWFFLAHVTVPNLSTTMFYYQTEFLKLEASFLGTVRVVGWLGLMLGTFIYNRYLKKMKLRRILM